MVHINFVAVLLSALIPLAVGGLWYNPKVFGTVWMKAAGMTLEDAKNANMLKTFSILILASIPLAFTVQFLVIHQFHFYSMLVGDAQINVEGSEVHQLATSTLSKYGDAFRTFKHGAFHGTLSGFTLATPILGINALFEQKSFKYVLVNGGYWALTLGLMGGVLSAFPA
jgi:hypothetical protein